MVQIPVEIFVGEARGADVALSLLQQVGWAAAMVALTHAVFAAGTRKLVVQGG